MTAIYADTANLCDIARLNVAGFTTNPTLMRAAGVKDYESWANGALELVDGKPVSFETWGTMPEMRRRAEKIAAWGENVYVKVPVVTPDGKSTANLLSLLDCPVNVTACFTLDHVCTAVEMLRRPGIISVFAGRIADTGRDPQTLMEQARAFTEATPHKLLWASPRQVSDLLLAGDADIITLPPAMIDKLPFGRDLNEFAAETSAMFESDAETAGYDL